MKKINIEKMYDDLKNFKGEKKANEFIFNLGNELKIFQSRLKNIIELIINKYYEKISPETLIKLKEINELCSVVNRLTNKKENKNINKYFDDFKLKINNKLDEIHESKKEKVINNNFNSESIDDALWIPKELLDVSNAINEKFQELDFSFIDGIKSNKKENLNTKSNDIFQIVDNEDDDVFLINGKEVDDESFLKALKSKI